MEHRGNRSHETLDPEDWDAVRVLGHRMKGSGAGYGFDALGDMGRGIEQAAQEKDANSLREQMEDLATYLERVEVIYE